MAVEFSFLCVALGSNCGPLYLMNLVGTFFAYVAYTRSVGKERIPMVRSKKDFEKKQEFFLNESIQNYETVKAFGGEQVEN